MKKVKTEEVDRISNLPEVVLHHILSFLSFKETVRTCVLSKKWKNVWQSYPVLEFDETLFGPGLQYPPRFDDKLVRAFQKRRRKLFSWLEQTLLIRHCRDMTSIKRLTIDANKYRDPKLVTFIDRCVSFALGCNVQELILKPWGNDHYCVPQIVFCAKSVNVLELTSCHISPRSKVNLSSLRKLCLSDAVVDNHVIKNLVGGCPLIEELSFSECYGLTSLKLFGLDRLNNVSVDSNDDLEEVDIKALNLYSLEIIFEPPEASKINIAYCENLKMLSMYGISIEDEWFQCLISKLALLECLKLDCCDDLKSIKILCPSLKRLLIRGCKSLVELKIDTPNLSVFEYFGDMISFSSNALALLNIYITLNTKKCHFRSIKYMELNAQFHRFSKTLKMELKTGKDVIVPKELRHSLSSPLTNGKSLFLEFCGSLVSFPISNIVDDLLWISPHTKSASILSDLVYSFEFSYKEDVVYEGNIATCCKSLPLLCWQRCIKQVKLEISCRIFQNENDQQTRCYFLEGADLLEMINACCTIARSKILIPSK